MMTIQQVSVRILKPKLAACVHHWRHEWEVHMHMQAAMGLEERYRNQVKQTHALEAELQTVKDELVYLRQAALEGRALEAELEKQMEEKLEAEKQKRIEHTREMAVRRIGKRDLARGWMAWVELYNQIVQERRMLKQAGARITRPKLVACMHIWREDWRADLLLKDQMTGAQKLEKALHERKQAQDQVKKLTKELEDARRAMAEGRPGRLREPAFEVRENRPSPT